MSRYEHSADLGWKADSEGGVAGLIFGGGLRMEDLPNDMPPPVRALVRQLIAVTPALEEVRQYLEKAVNDYDWNKPEEDGHLPNCSRHDICPGEGRCQ